MYETNKEYYKIINARIKELGLKKFEESWIDEYRQTKNQDIREKIVLYWFGLVVNKVQKWTPFAPEEDLLQEGLIGLMKAVDKHDPAKGKFFHSAISYINNYVIGYVYEKSHIIKLPKEVGMVIGRYRKAEERLMQELGRMPEVEEVVKKIGTLLGWTKHALKPALDYLNFTIESIDAPIEGKDRDTMTLGDTIVDNRIDIAELKISLELLQKHIGNVLKTLKDRERDIIKFRFGLEDGKELNNLEIGKKLKLKAKSKENLSSFVSTEFRHGIKKIQNSSLIKTLTDYEFQT
ncbi:MAG: hypothetical protein NTZ18_03690 [Candidatus Komeilibacteria bacterium]|nr:hypothetical protein [Candidatus Komeilibacteria bacterium]